MVDGYQRKIFFPEVVDIDQDGMILVFLNVYKDCCGKDPRCDYNGTEFLMQDKQRKYWHFKLEVKEVRKQEFLEDMEKSNIRYQGQKSLCEARR